MSKFLEFHKQFDKSDMLHKVIHLPEQIYKTYYDSEISVPVNYQFKKVNRIVFFGMGGSAISADFFKAIYDSSYVIEVIKDYQPSYIDNNTIVIAVSYSGNTEETLSAFEESLKFTDHAAFITSGGFLLSKYAQRFPYIKIEGGFPPRAAIGMLFFSIIKLFEELKFIDSQKHAVDAVIANLMQKAGALAKSVEEDYNIAKQAASEIQGKIPVIYAVNPKLSALAYRWKCQINENSKYPAFSHTFSEMNHNEIEAWEETEISKKIIPVFLSRLNEKDAYQKRVIVFKELLETNKVNYLEFFTEGKTLLEEFFSLVYLGDTLSVYLGLLQQIDPTEIKFINFLKNSIT